MPLLEFNATQTMYLSVVAKNAKLTIWQANMAEFRRDVKLVIWVPLFQRMATTSPPTEM
jgi:hypothetical protein